MDSALHRDESVRPPAPISCVASLPSFQAFRENLPQRIGPRRRLPSKTSWMCRGVRVGQRATAQVAAGLAFAWAAMTAYWVLNGTALLDTVGGYAQDLARARGAIAVLAGTFSWGSRSRAVCWRIGSTAAEFAAF